MTIDTLKETLPDVLLELLLTNEYALQNIYEGNVGERAPRNSGELLSFLEEHYEKYPQDLEKDLLPLIANQ